MYGSTENNNGFICRLTEIIEANLQNEQFGVNELVKEIGMSRSSVQRHVKALTRKSVSYFIRTFRLEKAIQLLIETDATAAEVAYQVGFGSPAYFNHCFHAYFGYPPGEARKRHFNLPETALPEGTQNFKCNSKLFTYLTIHISGLSRGKMILLGAAALIILVFFSILVHDLFVPKSIFTMGNSNPEKSVMVLPFKNLSSDADNQYFADGITEDILNHLSRISELKVLSRTSAEQFRESTLSISEISRIMKVNYILEGSVRKEHDKVRITVQLIDTKNDRHLWSDNYDRYLTDIFSIQSDIAMNVARELETVLSPSEKKQFEKIPTTNTDAYNYYLMGRFFWNKRTEEGLRRSAEYFEKAISADPDYALAYAGLADAWFIQTWWRWEQRPEGFEKAKQTALKALELDDNLAEAYATLGGIICTYNWDWEESREMFRKALQINPNYATAHQYYSELLDILGEREQAREHIDIAISLDPVVFMHRSLSAGYYYREGRYEEALETFGILEEINPEHRTIKYYYLQIYYRQGDHLSAYKTFREIIERENPSSNFTGLASDKYTLQGIDGVMHGMIELEQKNPNPNSYYIARWYALLEDKDYSLHWLERAFEERIPEIPRINFDVDFDFLRSEPRFLALIEKMGLSPYHARFAE
jgi:TolB-like protein/AraC-like DNA-binding protein